MPEFKQRLRDDLTASIKDRNEPVTATLRMVLTAISKEEVSGAAARELTDDEVLRVLGREAKKRREAAEAFDQAGRAELAARERLEEQVLQQYLPAQLTDEQLAEVAAAAVQEVTQQLGQRPGQRQLGQVMKLATAQVAGRAEGSRVATAVRALLT